MEELHPLPITDHQIFDKNRYPTLRHYMDRDYLNHGYLRVTSLSPYKSQKIVLNPSSKPISTLKKLSMHTLCVTTEYFV